MTKQESCRFEREAQMRAKIISVSIGLLIGVILGVLLTSPYSISTNQDRSFRLNRLTGETWVWSAGAWVRCPTR